MYQQMQTILNQMAQQEAQNQQQLQQIALQSERDVQMLQQVVQHVAQQAQQLRSLAQRESVATQQARSLAGQIGTGAAAWPATNVPAFTAGFGISGTPGFPGINPVGVTTGVVTGGVQTGVPYSVTAPIGGTISPNLYQQGIIQ